MNKKLELAINQQINAEFWSAYLYLSMSIDLESKGHDGIANWFMIQYQEEQAHAMKLLQYLQERDCKPTLLPIEGVRTEWASPLEAFEETLAHEKKVTELINNLASIAVEVNDFAAQSFLRWYVDEQVEEESGVRTIIDHLKLIGDNGMGLFQLNKDFAQRVFTPIV